jgi:transposase InsO family protein
MCRHLNVSKAGYYAWRSRKPSVRAKQDEVLLVAIKRVHQQTRRCYGRPRIHAELKAQGFRVAGKRIGRLMQICEIKGKKRSRSRVSNYAPGVIPAAPNVLNRQFAVARPNRAWVTDITYFATAEGWIYLAVVIDCFSRRVVGWSTDSKINSGLVLTALRSALHSRPFHKLILHSDRGSQFTCREYSEFLQYLGITASMSRKGNCWDNAVVESFFASIKVEPEPERTWQTRAEARSAIAKYIETWYNPRRRHSANAYLSPIAFERAQRCVI